MGWARYEVAKQAPDAKNSLLARDEEERSRRPILLPLPPNLEGERDKTSGTDPGAGQGLDIASGASATAQR